MLSLTGRDGCSSREEKGKKHIENKNIFICLNASFFLQILPLGMAWSEKSTALTTLDVCHTMRLMPVSGRISRFSSRTFINVILYFSSRFTIQVFSTGYLPLEPV